MARKVLVSFFFPANRIGCGGGSLLRKILMGAICLLAYACVQAPVALAQHGGGGHGGFGGGGFGGGHFGGGGGHFGGGRSGGGHASAPRGTAAPTGLHGTTGAHGAFVGLPGARFNSRSFLFRPRPVPHPTPQPQPIFFVPVFFNAPFFFCGGFNSFGWPSCGPFWGAGCFSPFYGYGYGYGGYGYGGWGYNGWWNNDLGDWGSSSPAYGAGGLSGGPTGTQTYVNPSYPTGQGARDLVELFFKDGTVHAVTDYWLADGQLHYLTLDARGEKAVENVAPFESLDLQTTVDVNTERGFRFQLRSESMEEYFRKHPEVVPKVDPEAPQN